MFLVRVKKNGIAFRNGGFYLRTGEPVENPESGIIPDSLFHLFRIGIALGNEKKKSDMPQMGAFYMADEEKLPFPHAGAGGAGENGGGGKSVFFPEERNGSFQSRECVGNTGIIGKFASGCAVIIKAFEK